VVKYLFLILLILQICNGCSEVASEDSTNDPPPPPPTPPVSTIDFLKSIAFTGDVLSLETRFVTYSKKVGRVSILDPIQEKEIWSRYADGYEYAIALPDYSGVTLVAGDHITVITQNAQKDFEIRASYAHMSVAAKAAAYSLASLDGTSIEVIRSMGLGVWQHETFTSPWGAVDADVTVPPENEPVLLVSSFNEDGTILTVFGPADGRYAVYTATSATEPLVAVDTWCPGDGIGTPKKATFSSLAWDATRRVFFAGLANGKIVALDPSVGCMAVDQLPVIDTGVVIPVNRLGIYQDGLIGVIQDTLGEDGSIKYVSFDDTGFIMNPLVYDNICEVPLGSMKVGDNYIVVMCTYELVLENPSDVTPSPSEANVDPRLYLTIDTISGEVINRVNIDGIASAGVVIDPSTQTLYRMLEGAFGTMEIINLVTGEQRRREGLFLEGILN